MVNLNDSGTDDDQRLPSLGASQGPQLVQSIASKGAQQQQQQQQQFCSDHGAKGCAGVSTAPDEAADGITKPLFFKRLVLVAATKPNKDCIKVNICAYTIGGSTKADKGRIKADMFACVRGGSTKPNKNGINADTCACVVGGSTKQLHSERPTFVPVFTQERLQRLDPVVLLQGLAADKKPRQEYLMQAMGRGRSVGMKVSASDELGGSSTELCLVTGFFRSPGYTVSNAMVHVS
eukprot:1157515-Pelagomonas_calceolata.AAC.1